MSDTVNDSVVQILIDQSLAQHPPQAGESIVFRVSRSFRTLQERRRTVEPLNINLAAAEHYMYARFLAGVSGDPTVVFALTIYGFKKHVYFALGIQDRMATTSMPVLPPNDACQRWGTRGANDGLLDYTVSTGKPATNYGNALSALLTEGRRYN